MVLILYIGDISILYLIDFREAILLGVCSSQIHNRDYFQISIPSCASYPGQSLLFVSRESLKNVTLEFSPYWASLFGSNMKPFAHELEEKETSSTSILEFSAQSGTFGEISHIVVTSFESLWMVPTLQNPFTAITSISKTEVAIGFSKNAIE